MDMTKRDLLKETHQAWRCHGVNIKRGAKLPSINRIKQLLGWLIQNINNIDKIYENTNEILLVSEIYDELIVSAPQFGIEISN